MADRSRFIINTSAEYFSAVYSQEDGSIKEFFENEDITVLAATRNEGKIQFHHRVPTEENCLLFYKIPHVGSSQPNDPVLGILTLEGGMVKSIYNSVSRVFSAHSSKKTEYTPELSGLLENLHISLGSTLGLPQTGIISIQDEINFWNQKSTTSSTKLDREQAQIFAAVLEKINKQIKQIDQNSLGTVEEFLDSAHNNLDEIWRLPHHYPQNRMADLMDVICNQIIETCVENLMSEDVWNLSSYHVNNLMNQILDISDSWMQLCDSLTRLFWPNYTQHPWVGPPHVPKRGQQFKDRLAEIKNIKNLFKQIATLLDDQTIRNMLSRNSPFRTINVFDTTPIGQLKWNKTLNQFEHILQPIDEKIALSIKSQLHNHLSNPRQVIFIFSKYDTLIQRPNVLDLLTIEREQFLQSLQILLQDLKKAMRDTNTEPDTGHLSTICNECRWLKIVEHQIQEIEKVSHLISGREGFDKVNQNIQELKEETETLLRTNFEIWSEQCSTAVKKGELRLREDQAVVQFEKEGRQLMRVTFNPQLVTFCQDVREFENLGYRVPIELRSSATHAAKFMSYARRLQQISTFHNTIGDRMIPCQRPIMLKNAMELSKLVQSESVAWNDEESVQRYVSILQAAVAKLAADNNLLVGYHEQAKRRVVKLMNTDLLTQGQVWKDEMRHLRELVASLESQGYTNLDAFKLHWDHQLYKVLEYQYILGLLDMNNKLPDLHIDIVFTQRQLQFRPAEEEIRSKYFSQLKKFIERPVGFRGLSEKSGDLFKIMVERNRHHFGQLFKRADELFKKLNDFKSLWLPWIALGCIDIEQLCNVHLVKWEDWDKNFKSCKHYSQQIAKIQNSEEQIDCFIINILPLRSDIEFISRRYWEALSSSLRSSILNDIESVQDFIQSSLQFLQNVPMDESSLAESGARYEKINAELPKVSETLNIVRGKDKCLAGWCKERVSSLSSLLSQWDKLLPLIENHSVVLQRQVDIMKNHIETQMINLTEEVQKFTLRWESTVAELEADENTPLTLFKDRQQHWKTIKEKKEKLIEDCHKLNMNIPQDLSEIFEAVETKIVSQSKQWEFYEQFLHELEVVVNEEWMVYRRRPYILTEFLSKWEGSVHSSLDLAASRIRQTVDLYQSILPTLQYLQSDSLTDKHWTKLFLLLKKDPKPSHNIIIKDIVDNGAILLQISNEIQNLVRQASSEQIVRQALNELDQWAVTAVLKLTTHSDSNHNPVPLIKDYNEVLNKIGDNQSLLQSAKNSSAFEAFSDQAEVWEARLNTLDHVLTSLSHSQRKWVYLEPVFGAGTLKNEEALFKRIDKDFRYIMQEIQKDPRVLSIAKINSITTIINSLENQLSRCQNTLVSFMTEKRNLFPRFYFLGDDDLLEILGQATKEEIVQKHIKKLFPGISELQVVINSDNSNSIAAIKSAEGDVVQLSQAVPMKDSIENWLAQLLESIQMTLKNQIQQCSQMQQLTQRTIQDYPMQVICTSRAINFTRQAERAMTSMALPSLLKSLREEVSKYTHMKNLTKDHLLHIKLKGLLLDLVHYAAVTEFLIEHNVSNQTDWHWLQQMKFYLNKDSKVYMKMVFAEFEYSYEFLGNPNKLVHTSLTHKCYLTLTQAMHLGLGGNPFGPAGTGKTECVKALGGMLGRLVLVFNCDENVDTEAMGLILTGLARCGAWGCFDEFNRLQEATLSAISMLIQPIQLALKDNKDSVQVMDKSVNLNHHCGIFVTLNPAGEEYGGRQQLPGNIQALFRPIVMQQPEPREICRVMLFVEGFKNANEIGERIVELFDLTKNMLSAERHYDWGLRELKTVLLACGREFRNSGESEQDELKIVVQALRSNTMSKLNLADSQRFIMLLSNVFPEVNFDNKTESELATAVTDSFSSLGLTKNDMQMEKVLQLYEQLSKRMGVVVVGPPSSGKTTIISLLKQALISTGKIIRTYTISPKSMSRIQLLGKLDSDTRQWNDGVLTTTAVAVNLEASHIHSWIICDGDVDPEWIEALNSVLDDNKLLTLPSGWRIQFGNNVNFIFETHDLSHASPATISRMGIINLSSEDLSWDPIIQTFLEKEKFSDLLLSYVDLYLKPAVEMLTKQYKSQLQVPGISVIRSTLQTLSNIQSKDEFCINIVQSILGFIPVENHLEFANKCFENAKLYVPEQSKADIVGYNKFRDSLEVYEADPEGSAENSLIETAHMKSHLNLIRKYLKGPCCPFIISGPFGSGKTLLLQKAVAEFSGYQLIVINCSSQLTPNYLLHFLKQNCITVSGVRGREYKPQQSRIVLFLKNIELCHIDSWGTRDVIELLLQLIQRNGFYADNLEWISITGLQICASMNNSTKQNLSPRYLAINNYLSVKYPSEQDLALIIQNQLNQTLPHFKKVPNTKMLVTVFIDFFREIQNNLKSEEYSHYYFTPKRMMNLLEGLTSYGEEYFSEAMITELHTLFRQRLATCEDIEKFDDILQDTILKILPQVKTDAYFIPSTSQNSIFSCVTTEEWKETIQKYITICNTESFCIQTPLVKEILEQTATISRLLARPSTHIVLVDRPGSCCIDSLYIAATLSSARIHIPQGEKSYSLSEFYNDLKMAMQSAAFEDQITILLIDHIWISYLPSIMKPVEAILEGSEIIDLFGEDLESVASSLKSAAQLEGYSDTLSSYFLNRVKKNLRIVISFDASRVNLDENFQIYPALYRSAEIIWSESLCTETIVSLPNLLIDMHSEDKDKIPKATYFTDCSSLIEKESPRRYFQLILSYCNIYQLFDMKTQKRLQKLKMGVEKLAAAHKVVGTLKSQAGKQEEALAEKRKLANDALEMISSTMRNANDQKSDLLELKKKTQESSEILKERKKAIELELSEVEPILKEASAAVGQIKSEALSEIRSLRAPPETIRDILEGVLRLMGIRDTSWNSMKSFLAKRGVKEDIRSLDPSRISPENCEAVSRLLEAKSDSFQMKNAKRASAAAAPLAVWVIASVKYAKVVQSIRPLEREQFELQRNLDLAENEMQSLMSGLDDVDARVKELSGQLNVYTQEAAVLELKLEEARNTLKSAEVLVEKLSSEFRNWNDQLVEYDQTYKTLDAKSFMISVTLNYLTNLTIDRRSLTIEKITSHLHIQPFSILHSLISEQDQVIWESLGLVRDAQAIENAALLAKMIELPFGSCPIPFVIDPSQTAINWLQEYLKNEKISFDISSQNTDKISYTTELAVRFGKILIVHDCQAIYPPLLQILFTRIYTKYNKKLLQVGNKLVDFHDNFRLILITKVNPADMGAEIESHLVRVPFTITATGLTDQLISKTILLKRPELEEKRTNLLKEEGKLLKQRIELEDELLEELSKAQGDILKNEKLFHTLNEVKESTNRIENSLKESSQIKDTLLSEYNQFRNLCTQASNFYINLIKMYEIPVEAFTTLFLRTLKDRDLLDEEKIYSLLVKITFQYLCRSTPKSEHLTLGVYTCRSAFPGKIKDPEWELFVTNFVQSEDTSGLTCPHWIKKEQASKVLSLIATLSEESDKFQFANQMLWQKYIDDERPEVPVQISIFQKVLVAQIFRPDVMASALDKMVSSLIGIKPTSLMNPTIEQLVEESCHTKPILIITEAGSDPSAEIKARALKVLGGDKYMEISMGRGMEEVGLNQIKRAAENGLWICIKNVHLIPKWLLELDRNLGSYKINSNFRLWIISDSIKELPSSFTYKCLKVLQESPDGLKNKVCALLQKWTPIISAEIKDPKVIKLHIALFILNSILQERLKYIPQGWSKLYEFGDPDLRAALQFLRWLEQNISSTRMDWSTLQGLCEHLAYGGRIENSRDLDTLVKYLESFLNEKVLSNRWSPLGIKVVLPTLNNMQDYYNTLQQFPDVDEPEQFGLSSLSNSTRSIAICKVVIKSLRKTHYQQEEAGGFEKRIRPILSLWKKGAANSTIIETSEKLSEQICKTPWEVFVFSEMQTAANLFRTIHATLFHLHIVTKDMKVISPHDKATIATLGENQIPVIWRKIWAGPRTATDYIKAVIVRGNAAERRCKEDLQLDFANTIDFAQIYNPDTFLAALKMAVSLYLKVSSCDLILLSSQNSITDKNVIKISPLIIDGASFKTNKLVIFEKNIIGDFRSPEFYVTFVEKRSIKSQTGVLLPLYGNSTRQRIICSLNIATDETIDSVLLSGAALIVPDI